MKSLIGVAALGAVCLLGCKTDSRWEGHSSAVSTPGQIVQSPDVAEGERGFLLQGTVVADYKDNLVIRDQNGIQRSLRVEDDTLYRQPDGELVARQYLEPGSEVRAAFDYNNKELIAREVIIDQDLSDEQPNAWPENPTPYPPNP